MAERYKDPLEERLDLLIVMVARLQDDIKKLKERRKAPRRKSSRISRTTIHDLRKRLAEKVHYIRELEKELKLTQ